MKKFLSIILSLAMMFSMSATTFATDGPNNTNRISRTVLDKIRGNTPVMTEAESAIAIELINEKADAQLLNATTEKTRSNSLEINQRAARIASIESELEAMGAIPLTIEDIYALNGLAYRPGAPDVPRDSNYVHFYGLTTYIGNHEVWSIVASSTGYDQSALPVPFYTDGTVTLYNQKAHVEADFRKYIDMATSAGSTLFEKAFKKLPVLNYIGSAWDIATFLNPTSTQKITIDYDGNQVYVYSYVAESSVGYFNFVMATERKQGTCVMISRQYMSGSSQVKNLTAGDYEARSKYYADYSHAVQLYKQGIFNYAYYVGDIQFKLDNSVVARINMPVYPSLWSIPGI